MKRNIILSLGLIVTFIGIAFFSNPVSPVLSDTNSSKPENIASPTSINGWTNVTGTNISYRYGEDTFDAHDSFQVANNGTSHDSYVQTRVQNLSMDLVNLSSIVVQKYLFRITQTVYVNSTYNTTSTFVMDNNTYDQYLINLNASSPFNGHLYVDYSSLNPTYGIADTAIITTNNDYLGSFPTNETFVVARDPFLKVNISHIQEIIGIVVSHTPIKNVQVTLNETLSVDAYFAYYNAYNVTYNIHATQWSAQIRDGDRMGLYVSAFKDLEMNYTEVRYSVLSYYLQSSLQVNLTYANGTYVPFENYPFALRPAFYQQNGTIEDIGIRYINTTSLVASTTAVQAFHAQLSKNLNNTHIDASSFVEWMVGSTPRLLAYKDVNLNNQLDLQYDPTNGLQSASGDYIPYVGLLEATSGNAITYEKTNQTYDQHIFTLQGFELINQTDKGINQVNEQYDQFHYGFGNAAVAPTINTYGDAPINQSGTFVFKFGVEYQNFPVSWLNLRDGLTTETPMNISYDYVYTINPYLGEAKLSPTITYGAVTNPTLKSDFSGLSLATMYESDFLSVAALRATRLQQTNENVTSSRASVFASVSFSGPQNNFTNVDTRGNKANYTLDGVNHTTSASILNIASFAGSAVASNVTVFQSDSQNIAGSAMMKNSTITGVSLNYRKDIILVSYPDWSGGKIVHDPTFSAVYQANSVAPQITVHPADSTVDEGTPVSMTWQVYDQNNDGATYVIKDENGNQVKSGSWQSGNSITLTVTPTAGVHSYTLTITDKAGNHASQTVKLTVTASTTSTSSQPTTSLSGVTDTNPSGTSSAPGFELGMVILFAVISAFYVLGNKRKRT